MRTKRRERAAIVAMLAIGLSATAFTFVRALL
jgi:hypothetical protein